MATKLLLQIGLTYFFGGYSKQQSSSKQTAGSKRGGHMWTRLQYLKWDGPDSPKTWWAGTPL